MEPGELEELIQLINAAFADGFHIGYWEENFMQSVTFQFELWKESRIGAPLTAKQVGQLLRIQESIAHNTLMTIQRRGAL